MLTLLATISVLFFSAVAVLTGLQLATFLALAAGSIYFGWLLVRQFSQLPALNLPTFIAVGSGLFYFVGGSLAVGAHLVIGENPYNHIFERWKNYDASPMAAAMCLAFACSLLTIAVSRRISFRNLSALTSSVNHYAGDWARVLPDRALGIVISVVAGALSAVLLATGTLKPQGAADLTTLTRANGNEWIVLFTNLSPATYLLFACQLCSRHTRLPTKLLIAAAALPVFFGTLMLGRRYIIAAAITACIGLVAYRGVRMRPLQWLATVAGLIALFFAISAPFLAFRQALLGNKTIGVEQLIGGAFSGDRVAGVQKLSLTDVAAMSAARADIMSDLAQLTTRIPPKAYRFGSGLASEFALIVPNFAWPEKAQFLATRMYNDFSICRDASLPPTDLAGTLVLYSFGELGWLAPLWFTGVLLAFAWIADRLVGMARSFTFKLLTVSSLVVYAIVADNQWGGTLLGVVRFLAVGAVLVAATRVFTMRPARAPMLGRPPHALTSLKQHRPNLR